MLQPDREAGGVLHAVAAPGRADAGFHRAQGFTVGVSGFKPGLHQRLPDRRQLFQSGAEKIDTLSAGNFAVQAVAFRNLPDGNQPVGSHFPCGHARHDGVCAVLLDVGEVAVVGILQRQVRRFQQILVPAGGEHRSHQRLADLASVPLSVAADKLVKGADMVDAHEVVNLLARVREVLADVLFHLHALLRKLELHHLLHQRGVFAGIAHQHAAEQRFAVVADHDFLVDLLRAVRPLVAQRSRGAPVGVAERGHVHAEQLELSAHIRAGEGFILSRQRGGGHARHLIAGRDKTEDFPLPQGAFADGQHVRIGGLAAVVNADPAAFADSQPAAARQRVLRTNARRKDHHVRFQLFAIGKAQHQPAVRGGDLRRGFIGVNADAQRLDFLAQHRRAVVVELDRHQVGRKLHHVGFQPELLQGIRRLQSEQAAANHHAAARARRMCSNVVQVVKGAVDKTARQIVARHGRNERV